MTASTPRLGPMIVAIAVIATALGCVLAFVPVWPCTLLEHFRVQAVVGGIAVTGVAVAARSRLVDAAALATLVHVVVLAPDLVAARRPVPAGTPVRVLVLNVLTSNTNHAAVRALIAREQPDVVALVEVDRRWLAALAPALAAYAGRIEEPRDDNFGVALYARGAVVGAARPLGAELPTIVADVTLAGARFDVLVTHPLPPIFAAAEATHRRQLDAVAAVVRASPRPVVLVGDLNATPWSRPIARLITRTGLCDTRAGFGLQASFPTGSVWRRIPIDHALVSCAVGVRDRRLGPDVGSDHLPVIVDLVLPPP